MARYDTVTSTLHGYGDEIVRNQGVYVYQGITPVQSPREEEEDSQSPPAAAKRQEDMVMQEEVALSA